VDKANGVDGRQELRQVLRDLLDLHLRGGFTGDSLLLLLSLVNILGVLEILGRRQGGGEGQFFQQLLGPLVSAAAKPQAQEGGETSAVGLRVVPGAKELAGLLGNKEGLKMLAGLLANREVMEKVVPLLQRLGGGQNPGLKGHPDNGKEVPGSRKSQGREVIHWDFGRNDVRK